MVWVCVFEGPWTFAVTIGSRVRALFPDVFRNRLMSAWGRRGVWEPGRCVSVFFFFKLFWSEDGFVCLGCLFVFVVCMGFIFVDSGLGGRGAVFLQIRDPFELGFHCKCKHDCYILYSTGNDFFLCIQFLIFCI